MKRTFPIIFTLLISVFLISCLDSTPPIETFVAFGTVENPNKKPINYNIRLDNDTVISVISSNYLNYTPEDGQRVIVKFSILEDKRNEEIDHHYDVQVFLIQEMLTQKIFAISPETQDSIGNDKLTVEAMWIGNHYLNVGFYIYHQYEKQHLINLVIDSTKSYEDDKIHLELRHNAKEDNQAQRSYGYASFDIRSLQHLELDSVEIVVHTKPYLIEEKKDFELTYKYAIPEPEYITPRSVLRRLDENTLMDEIK